jgi:hypothetical protein
LAGRGDVAGGAYATPPLQVWERTARTKLARVTRRCGRDTSCAGRKAGDEDDTVRHDTTRRGTTRHKRVDEAGRGGAA